MTLKEARQLQAEVKRYGTRCIVPLGHGPADYFCRIFEWSEEARKTLPRDFEDRVMWRVWQADRIKRRRRQLRAIEAMERAHARRLSPIEMMIDKACGYQP